VLEVVLYRVDGYCKCCGEEVDAAHHAELAVHRHLSAFRRLAACNRVAWVPVCDGHSGDPTFVDGTDLFGRMVRGWWVQAFV